MEYLTYRPAGTATMLVGMEQAEILKTIDYYINERHEDLIKPYTGGIRQVDSLSIELVFPMIKVDQYVQAEVREGVRLDLNANAYPYLMGIIGNFDNYLASHKRGELYKFNAQLGGMWLLPRFIMDGIGSYDWKQHEKRMEDWLQQREEALDELEQKGAIIRPNKGKR